MAFAVATCPKCRERFRLIWRIGNKRPQPSQVIRLTCPTCGHSFEQIAVRLVVFDAGKEGFPVTAVVDETCLTSPARLTDTNEQLGELHSQCASQLHDIDK
jgi:hypothetical protein